MSAHDDGPRRFGPHNIRATAFGHRSRRVRVGRQGVACAELAVVLPLIAFMFVLGIDWCRIYYAAHTLDDCARSGALSASGIAYQERDLSDAERIDRGKTEATKDGTNLKPALQQGQVTVTPSGDYVTVTVEYDFRTITPYPVIGGTWNLSRSVRMPVMP